MADEKKAVDSAATTDTIAAGPDPATATDTDTGSATAVATDTDTGSAMAAATDTDTGSAMAAGSTPAAGSDRKAEPEDRKAEDRKPEDKKPEDKRPEERVARGKAAGGRVITPLRGDMATTRLPVVKEPEPLWLALDLPVMVFALVLLAVGAVVHGVLARPRLVPFEKEGLVVLLPASYSLRTPLIAPPGLPAETTFRRPGGEGRIVVRVEEKPAFLGSVESLRELQRSHALGEHYRQVESRRVQVNGREWLRTRFRYVGRDAQPTEAVEYTFPADLAVNSPHLYVVQAHGTARLIERLEGLVLARLQVKVPR